MDPTRLIWPPAPAIVGTTDRHADTIFNGDCFLDKFQYVPTPYWIIALSVLTLEFLRQFLNYLGSRYNFGWLTVHVQYFMCSSLCARCCA